MSSRAPKKKGCSELVAMVDLRWRFVYRTFQSFNTSAAGYEEREFVTGDEEKRNEDEKSEGVITAGRVKRGHPGPSWCLNSMNYVNIIQNHPAESETPPKWMFSTIAHFSLLNLCID